NDAWRLFLQDIPADELPHLFEVYLVLGKAREAAQLASTPAQRRSALAGCLASREYPDAAAGISLAEALADSEGLKQIHERVGDILIASRDFARALDHFMKAECALKTSQCHEQLGDYLTALQTCPHSAQDRMVVLVQPCQEVLLEFSRRHEYLLALQKLQT